MDRPLLFEIRPQSDKPTNIFELPFAKLHCVKSSTLWKLYWIPGSGKWEAYESNSETSDLQELLLEIDQDVYGGFLDDKT